MVVIEKCGGNGRVNIVVECNQQWPLLKSTSEGIFFLCVCS